jgi:hypothetical protein
LNAVLDLLHLVHPVRASVAGPLTTAPLVMSNRDPWHWHMTVVPVRGAERRNATAEA